MNSEFNFSVLTENSWLGRRIILLPGIYVIFCSLVRKYKSVQIMRNTLFMFFYGVQYNNAIVNNMNRCEYQKIFY